MNTKTLNLDILTKQYRYQAKPEKGFELLIHFLENNDNHSLDHLLRNHDDDPIILSTEIEARDNINELLDFYSLIQIALFSNYIHHPLSDNISLEIDVILHAKSINKYYTKVYPLVLPQLIAKQIHLNEFYRNHVNIDGKAIFDRFLILNQHTKNDDEIQLLIRLLKGGALGDYTITTLHNLLKSKNNKPKEYTNKYHPLNKILWGFTKLTHFIYDLSNLLRDAQFNPILQSAIWHYYTSLFNNHDSKIRTNLNITLQIIKTSFLQFNSKELIYDQLSHLSSIEEIKDWKSNANHLESIESDIEYLFNIELGQPLHDLNNSLNSN